MKRSAALQPLSRDHHQALFLAQRLKRADEESAGEAGEAFLEFWSEHGKRHFRDEEEILLPAYAAYGNPHEPLVARVLTDHVEIRHRARRLTQARAGTADGTTTAGDGSEDLAAGTEDSASAPLPDPGSIDDLHQIGELLANHVRREERELFPMIEAAMPEDAAAELASIFIEAEQDRGSS